METSESLVLNTIERIKSEPENGETILLYTIMSIDESKRYNFLQSIKKELYNYGSINRLRRIHPNLDKIDLIIKVQEYSGIFEFIDSFPKKVIGNIDRSERLDSSKTSFSLQVKTNINDFQTKNNTHYLSTYAIPKYETYSLLKISKEHKLIFFNLLKTNEIISGDTSQSTFLDAFSGEEINYQPKIKWLKTHILLAYLINKLVSKNLMSDQLNYNKINLISQIFVKPNNEKFSPLKTPYSRITQHGIDGNEVKGWKIVDSIIEKIK